MSPIKIDDDLHYFYPSERFANMLTSMENHSTSVMTCVPDSEEGQQRFMKLMDKIYDVMEDLKKEIEIRQEGEDD